MSEESNDLELTKEICFDLIVDASVFGDLECGGFSGAYCSDARGVRLCRDGSVMNGTGRHLDRKNCDSSMYQSLVCVFRGD